MVLFYTCPCRNINDEALQHLADMPSVATLTLRATTATNAGLKALQALPHLSHLDLGSKWELDDAGLAAVAACPQLKILAVGSFNLVRPNLCNPKGLQKVEHLSFGGGFANKGLHLLFPLLNLKSLYVQVSPASAHLVCHLDLSVSHIRMEDILHSSFCLINVD